MVYRLIKNGTNLMFQRQTTIMSAAGVLMVMSLGSAILGFIGVRMLNGLAVTTSAKDGLDAFKAAFQIPDLMFQVLVAGALNAAFIPMFGELIAKKHREKAWLLTTQLLNIVLVVFGVIGLVVFIFAEPLTKLIVTPGYTHDKLALTAELTRLMMVSPILLGISGFLTGSIQVHRRFIVPALAPILYNVGGLVGIVWLYPRFGVHGLAYGIILGAVLHLLIQLPLALHLGFRYRPIFNFKDKAVLQVGKLMVPRTVGLSIDKLETLVASMLVSTLGSGSLLLFSHVFSLITFPVLFFGVSIAQASLPTLATEALDNLDDFRQTLLTTFHQILFLIVPVTVLLVVLKLPITRLALNFPEWETQTLEAAQLLLFFAPGLIAQASIHLWVRGFYALQDTVSPLKAAAAGVIVSVGVALLTISTLGMRGIALGMVVGGFGTLMVLMWLMRKRLGGFSWDSLYLPTLRILFCGFLMSVVVYFSFKAVEEYVIETSTTLNLLMLSLMVSWLGGTLYLFISWLLGSNEVLLFFGFAQKLRKWREAFVRIPNYQEPATSTATATVTTTDISAS
jgi:putative peptidoglycan lipid II flippase